MMPVGVMLGARGTGHRWIWLVKLSKIRQTC